MKRHRYLRLVKSIGALILPLATVVLTLSSLSVAGYLFQIEFFYRPIENGPATHPFTALCFFFTAIALLGNYPTYRSGLLQNISAVIVLVLLSVWVVSEVFDLTLVGKFTPFLDIVEGDLEQGNQNSLGLNTAAMLTFVTTAILSCRLNYLLAALLLATAGFAIPFAALFGYAIDAPFLYGDMSFMTLTMGLFSTFVGIATASQTILVKKQRHDQLKLVLSLGLTLVCAVSPIIISVLLFTTVITDKGNPFGLLILAICWLLIQMIGLFIYAVENVEVEKARF
ncbi:hypothetical protein [Alteromonas ponticola]|uniref:DUF998 domain-containing protein n=1 Tax=Alteromonas ponticola TaxID=2720613 RepID=A0ABX1R1N8_9ALTE|nr:hypothetical protein [Alteromonas ponticola]NMH60375.1 hypothetical protein [Alteromonas ponticola]